MSYIDALLLGIALAMDCFTVSITCGIIERRLGWQVLVMALTFGFFQAGMALLGWVAGDLISPIVLTYNKWVACGLLVLLGIKMIWEGFCHKEEDVHFNPSNGITILMMALATSIDALAVGFSFIWAAQRDCTSLYLAVGIIGLTSLLAAWLGKYIGVVIGRRFCLPMEQLGGVILVIIGIKTLLV